MENPIKILGSVLAHTLALLENYYARQAFLCGHHHLIQGFLNHNEVVFALFFSFPTHTPGVACLGLELSFSPLLQPNTQELHFHKSIQIPFCTIQSSGGAFLRIKEGTQPRRTL